MITRIEIDGFKTFRRFDLELAPFQLIVGANGAGKSNLFDALRLLSQLAEDDLNVAFSAARGGAASLFSMDPDGSRVPEIRLAVELLVDPVVQDGWGQSAELSWTRLRYEVAIGRAGGDGDLESLVIRHESLSPVIRQTDSWAARYLSAQPARWRAPDTHEALPFISTVADGEPTIILHRDGDGQEQVGRARAMARTRLSGAQGASSPHAFAANQELRGWYLVALVPASLRQPGSGLDPQVMTASGANLPSALARIGREDPQALRDVARDLADLVPGVRGIEVEVDIVRREVLAYVQMQGDRRLPASLLSDGTLRLMALSALSHDSGRRGVLLLEEPEDGLYPTWLDGLASLLRGLATDLADPQQSGEPLRQAVVSTHSPALVRQPGMRDHLLFAQLVSRVQPGQAQVLRVTHIVPLPAGEGEEGAVGPEERYAQAQVEAYLAAAPSSSSFVVPGVVAG